MTGQYLFDIFWKEIKEGEREGRRKGREGNRREGKERVWERGRKQLEIISGINRLKLFLARLIVYKFC